MEWGVVIVYEMEASFRASRRELIGNSRLRMKKSTGS
jgi:hypothetical protein